MLINTHNYWKRIKMRGKVVNQTTFNCVVNAFAFTFCEFHWVISWFLESSEYENKQMKTTTNLKLKYAFHFHSNPYEKILFIKVWVWPPYARCVVYHFESKVVETFCGFGGVIWRPLQRMCKNCKQHSFLPINTNYTMTALFSPTTQLRTADGYQIRRT